MEWCYVRGIQDLFADGKTPYETRYDTPFRLPIIPFWIKDILSSHLFLQKTRTGSVSSAQMSSNLFSLDMP